MTSERPRQDSDKDDKYRVPGTGSGAPDEASAHGQGALRLHAGIAAIAVVLSALVTFLFILLKTTPLAIVFGVITLLSLVILGWAIYRKRRGERRRSGAGTPPPAS